jgi:DNA-binding Lrp family transcriptional regulator
MTNGNYLSLDSTDRLLLDALQGAFPLCERPFDELGRRAGIEEAEAVRRVRELKDAGLIRWIGAIFDSAALGYRGALVALELPAGRIEAAAQIVSAHPGVTHNYQRDHVFSLWFTLTTPPGTDPQRHAAALASEAGAERYLFLPAVRLFKIGVRFAMSDEGVDPEEISRNGRPRVDRSEDGLKPALRTGPQDGLKPALRTGPQDGLKPALRTSPSSLKPQASSLKSQSSALSAQHSVLSPQSSALSTQHSALSTQHSVLSPQSPASSLQPAVRALQEDLPIEPRPFETLATLAGMSVAELLEKGRDFLASGMMRRYAAILRHREAGFTVNVMSVWRVPEDKAEEAGRRMAEFAEVSHCYQRPTAPGWPYSHYAMIHARSEEEASRVVRQIASRTGLRDYALLRTVREFKKTRVKYFTPEIVEWGQKHLKGS